jgi:hypothetical protein
MSGIGIILTLIVACCILKEVKKLNKSEGMTKEEIMVRQMLAGLVQQKCEIVMKEPSWLIDIPYSVEGTVKDIDDEWVLISIQKSKKEILKMLRISMIKDVKEIGEKSH